MRVFKLNIAMGSSAFENEKREVVRILKQVSKALELDGVDLGCFEKEDVKEIKDANNISVGWFTTEEERE